jgi:protein TonB
VLFLFALIESLIADRGAAFDGTKAQTVDFSRRAHDELTRASPRPAPRKPDPPTRPPAYAQIAALPALQVPVMPIEGDVPPLAIKSDSGARPSIEAGVERSLDSAVVPLFRAAPRYPHEALMNRTEGWVEIEFTIAVDGSVKDAVVVGAQPDRVFERDALRAIVHWKFQPFVVGGVAVERRARQIIEFTLDQAG